MADSIIDLVIKSEFEGDGFKKAVKELDKLEKSAKGLGGEFDDFDKSAKKASDGLSVLDIAAGGLVAGGITALVSGLANGALALGEWGAEAVELASNLRETESLLSNALGPAYDEFNDRVNEIADATGRSGNAFKEATAPIIAMTKAQGFAADEAGRLAAEFGQAAIDINSYFNSPTGFEDLQSALAGSSETLFKYGINAKEGALQQEALRLGIVNSLGPLEQAERTTALLSLVQTQAADAMGDAARTADSYANQQRTINDLWVDFKTEVGLALVEGLGPAQQTILELAEDNLPQLADSVTKAIKPFAGLGIAIGEFADSEFLKNYKEFNQRFKETVDFIETFGGRVDNTSYWEQLAEDAERFDQQLESIQSRGGAGRGGGNIRIAIDEAAFEEALTVADSFDQRLTEISQKNYEISDPFGNFDVSDVDFDSFFGDIDATTQTTITNLQNVGRAVSDIQSTIDNLDAGNLVAQLGDAQSGVIENVLGGLAGAGADIDTQAEFLSAAGVGADELREKFADLAEQAAADAALVAVELGASNESVLSFVEEAQAAADSAADPIEAVKGVIEEFQTSLSDLSGKSYPVNMSFSFEGQDILDDVYSKIQAITGADLDVPNLENAFDDAFGDGSAQAANRRR